MLPPDQLDSIERFFTALKSVNELDVKEIRGGIGGILSPTSREAAFILNYRRAVLNFEFLLTLKTSKNYQVTAMIARTCMELAVELRLIANDPDAGEKVPLFIEVEKLKFAKKVVEFKASNVFD